MSDSSPRVEISDSDTVTDTELLDLYEALGWRAYTRDPASLVRAIANSTFVVTARHDGQLIGLARGLSDDVSIFYLQDILIRQEFQGRGIGRQLMSRCQDRYQHVRTHVLMTDDLASQFAFYRSTGWTRMQELEGPPLNIFVRFLDEPDQG
ncbi:MAG: GNAT family N-acetyltransferase [Acidimicrobiia bacterium]|nr:GNAT family N-acetyltransferase [Acidimicrobiia bacterium]